MPTHKLKLKVCDETVGLGDERDCYEILEHNLKNSLTPE